MCVCVSLSLFLSHFLFCFFFFSLSLSLSLSLSFYPPSLFPKRHPRTFFLMLSLSLSLSLYPPCSLSLLSIPIPFFPSQVPSELSITLFHPFLLSFLLFLSPSFLWFCRDILSSSLTLMVGQIYFPLPWFFKANSSLIFIASLFLSISFRIAKGQSEKTNSQSYLAQTHSTVCSSISCLKPCTLEPRSEWKIVAWIVVQISTKKIGDVNWGQEILRCIGGSQACLQLKCLPFAKHVYVCFASGFPKDHRYAKSGPINLMAFSQDFYQSPLRQDDDYIRKFSVSSPDPLHLVCWGLPKPNMQNFYLTCLQTCQIN